MNTANNDNWQPIFSPWRHGGWYVDNLRYPSGAVGCVSRNYPDKKWRIVCDSRSFNERPTFKTRIEAAYGERKLIEGAAMKTTTETAAIAVGAEAVEIERNMQREFMTCPECKRDVHTKPAEGVPAQALRACDDCGAVFFMDTQSKPRYESPTKTVSGVAGKLVYQEINGKHGIFEGNLLVAVVGECIQPHVRDEAAKEYAEKLVAGYNSQAALVVALRECVKDSFTASNGMSESGKRSDAGKRYTQAMAALVLAGE